MPIFSSYDAKKVLDKIEEPTGSSLSDLFKPTYNAEGKTKVVLRFLPPPEGEDFPFVKIRKHYVGSGIKGAPFFSGNCIQDKGKCPLCEKYFELKKKGEDMTKQRTVIGPAKNEYIANVYIVENPTAPATEGKVFRYRFTEATMNVIKEIAKRHDDDETDELVEGIDVFSPTNGADFIYKYDKSHKGGIIPNKFKRKTGPISDKNGVPLNDEQLMSIAKQIKPLANLAVNHDTYESLCKGYTARIHLPIGHTVEEKATPENISGAEPKGAVATEAAIQNMFN